MCPCKTISPPAIGFGAGWGDCKSVDTLSVTVTVSVIVTLKSVIVVTLVVTSESPITGLPAPPLNNSSICASVSICPFQIAKSSMLNLFSTKLPSASFLLPSESVLFAVIGVPKTLVPKSKVSQFDEPSIQINPQVPVVFPLSIVTVIMCHWPSSGGSWPTKLSANGRTSSLYIRTLVDPDCVKIVNPVNVVPTGTVEVTESSIG